MRLRYYSWFFCFLSFFGLSSVYADTSGYYYTVGFSDFKSSDPAVSCQSYLSSDQVLTQHYSNITYASVSPFANDATHWMCWINYNDGVGQQSTYFDMYRHGDGCSPGSVYDLVKGVCTPSSYTDGQVCTDQSNAKGGLVAVWDSSKNQCIDWGDASPAVYCKYQAGNTDPQTYTISGVATGGSATAPPTFVQQGFDCQMATVTSSNCVTDAKGSATCQVTGKYTGNLGSGVAKLPDADCTATQTCKDMTPETTNNTDPCTYVTDSAGNSSCSSKTEVSQQGTQNCGTVNGSYVCVTTPPKSNGVDITTKVSSTTASDGTVTTTKTDNATSNVCTDVNTCTSQTSQTVTVTTKNGTTGAVSTGVTCTGACTSTGTGITGSGNGTGDGTCTSDCGEGGGHEDWYTKKSDTYDSVFTEFQNSVTSAPIVSSVKSFLIFNPSGSCPRYNIDVLVFHAVLDQWCSGAINWSLIAAVVIAAAAIYGFRIAFF